MILDVLPSVVIGNVRWIAGGGIAVSKVSGGKKNRGLVKSEIKSNVCEMFVKVAQIGCSVKFPNTFLSSKYNLKDGKLGKITTETSAWPSVLHLCLDS